MANLFSTHPAMENRIAALEQLERELGGSGASFAPASSGRGPWG